MTIASQQQRLTTGIAAVRATLARHEVRILVRGLSVAMVALAALKARSLFGQLGAVGHPELTWLDWLADCLALYASLMAVHATVPARGVILVYILAQLVAQVAVLPGGGGTVELSLAAGFAAFSGHHGTVFAGVLLYRFLACWGLIPIGWLAVLLDSVRMNNAPNADGTSSSRVDPSPLPGERRANDSVHRIRALVRSHMAREAVQRRV